MQTVKTCTKKPTDQPPKFWSQEYDLFWNTYFSSGPQKVCAISYLNGLLELNNAFDFIKDKTFNNWQEVAKHLLDHKDDIDWRYIDCAYEDDRYDEIREEIDNLKTPKQMLQYLLDGRDPLILVLENNDMLRWIKSEAQLID